MGGETEREVSGLTVDTLRMLMQESDRRYATTSQESDRRYALLFEELDKRLTQRMDLSDKAITAALAAAEKAVAVAEINATRWRDQANEWRAAMSDRERTFPTKDSVDVRFASHDKEIAELQKVRNRVEGQERGGDRARETIDRNRNLLLSSLAIVAVVVAAVIGYLAHYR